MADMQISLHPDSQTEAAGNISFKDAFEGKAVALAENLEVDEGLLRRLKDDKVILPSHVSKIKLLQLNDARVDLLLEILERRPDSMFPTFCAALEAHGQQKIVEILKTNNSLR